MGARIPLTIAASLAAAFAFFDGGPVASGPLNPFGILFAFLALVIWFAWDAVSAGYASSRPEGDSAELPLLARFGPVFISGITESLRTVGLPRQHPKRGKPGRS